MCWGQAQFIRMLGPQHDSIIVSPNALCYGVSIHNISGQITCSWKMNKFSHHFCPTACWLMSDFWNSVTERKTTEEAENLQRWLIGGEIRPLTVTCCTGSWNLRFGGTSEGEIIYFSPLATTSLFSVSRSLFLFGPLVCLFALFFRFHVYVKPYIFCIFFECWAPSHVKPSAWTAFPSDPLCSWFHSTEQGHLSPHIEIPTSCCIVFFPV